MRHLPLIVLTTVAITGCGTIASSGDETTQSVAASPGQAIATVATPATSSPPTSTETNASPTTAAQPESIRLPPPPTAAAPRSRTILDVATRFAHAYLLYQIGRAPRSVMQTIRSTCTQSFARLLLSQPVSVPSAQRRIVGNNPLALGSVTYTGPASLGPGPPVQIVVARYSAIAHPETAEQLTIEVTAADGGWLVTSLG
jgi:hypothetical protein